MDEKKDWFYVDEGHSELYKRFRPTHPASLFRLIDSKLQASTQALSPSLKQEHGRMSNGRWAKALDVGCGTGLSTLPLTEFVQETFGIDRSQSQIYQATLEYGNKDPSRVIYLKADVADTLAMFPASSFDLVSVADASHWMDREELFKDAFQLLRPGGLLVLYQSICQNMEDPKVDKIMNEFLENSIFPWMYPDARISFRGLEEIRIEMLKYFPDLEWSEEPICIKSEMSIDEIKGYYASYCSYQKYLKQKKPGEADMLEDFIERIKLVHLSSDKLKYTMPYHVLLGRKPEH